MPPEPFAARFPSDPYTGEIAFTDFCIGQVIQKLKQLGLYDSSLIVLTGDHGEMLGEHGEQEHTYFIYESAIKVPLLFKLPGRSRPRRISDIAGLIDIAPTICGLLNIDTDHMQGRDLSGKLFGKSDSRNMEYYSESITPTRYGACALLGVISDNWKYIQSTRPELAKAPNNGLVKRPAALQLPV